MPRMSSDLLLLGADVGERVVGEEAAAAVDALGDLVKGTSFSSLFSSCSLHARSATASL